MTSASHRRGVLVLAMVLLAAACLRSTITTVGPVLEEISDSTGYGDGTLGLLAATPLVAFALVSPFAATLARKWGLDRVLRLVLFVLATGVVFRSLPSLPTLWLGTLAIGAAVATCNVLLPAVVKRDFPGRVTAVTGAYSATMGGAAAMATGTVVPLGLLLGGWRQALAVWALLPLLAAVLWVGRPSVRSSDRPALPQGRSGSLLRSAGAWQLTVFFGLQSASFYTLITWLPTIDRSFGASAAEAGFHLFGYQCLGVVSGVLISLLMQGRTDQRLPALLVGVPVVVAVVGLLVLPGASVLWVVLAGLGSGSSLTVSLALVALRSSTVEETAALSGMVQSLGYLIAAAGPLSAGAIFGRFDSRIPVLSLLLAISFAQIVLSLWAACTEGPAARIRAVALIDVVT